MVDEFPGEFPDVDAAENAWRPQFRKYNQTLRALRAGLGLTVDSDKYWEVTRGDPGELLSVNTEALKVLQAVTKKHPALKKVILTNCAEKQAKECLKVLGLLDCFDAVYGADTMGAEMCKPELNAFDRIKNLAGFEYTKTVFFEDSVKNLAAAKELGMTCVLIKSETTREEGTRDDGFAPDHVIDAVTLSEIERILPGLLL